MKRHACVCGSEYPGAWQCLKFLKADEYLVVYVKGFRTSAAVHNTKASGTVKVLFVLAGSPKAEQAGSQNCCNRREILATLTSVGVLP